MFAGILDLEPFYLKAWTYLALLGMLLILFGIIMAGWAQADRNQRLRKKPWM
jgi:uncharacterized membrane protein